ncbi:hypothetical protein AB0D54_32135 [Streptomyces xanthophaeus]|uniref:hypothetical protein n=1 Tax=Streptomyces xanthophaeus TaxID=67385 RepID=UPI003425E159
MGVEVVQAQTQALVPAAQAADEGAQQVAGGLVVAAGGDLAWQRPAVGRVGVGEFGRPAPG